MQSGPARLPPSMVNLLYQPLVHPLHLTLVCLSIRVCNHYICGCFFRMHFPHFKTILFAAHGWAFTMASTCCKQTAQTHCCWFEAPMFLAVFGLCDATAHYLALMVSKSSHRQKHMVAYQHVPVYMYEAIECMVDSCLNSCCLYVLHLMAATRYSDAKKTNCLAVHDMYRSNTV